MGLTHCLRAKQLLMTSFSAAQRLGAEICTSVLDLLGLQHYFAVKSFYQLNLLQVWYN